MKQLLKCGTITALMGMSTCAGAFAADRTVLHNQEVATSPFASSVIIPEGYDTVYISGVPGQGGDTAAQTAMVLGRLKAQLTTLGLTFADVVQAHVFLVGDPNTGGKMDFAGMNSEWFKEFGTTTQPNKPARATVQAAGLAGEGALVEIEMTAVKKRK
jgi:enamine deaminase RidA (YjgF/YER057c/UK114 family)